MDAPEFRTLGCGHLVNRGVRYIGAERNWQWSRATLWGSGSPHPQPLTENRIILDVFASPDPQMWVARLLGNFLKGTEKARFAYEELKCKSMLDSLAELHKWWLTFLRGRILIRISSGTKNIFTAIFVFSTGTTNILNVEFRICFIVAPSILKST